MKKKILFFVYFFGIILIGYSFYSINELNYEKNKLIQLQIIHHPELLPKKEIAQATSFGFKKVRADLYWLEAIQYIGGNVIGSEYKKYLYHMLDLITDLDPYFQKPYLIGQLLLPHHNERYENLADDIQMKHILQGELLGLKGIKYFCTPEMLEEIKKEEDLGKLFGNTSLRNPCKNFDIPFHQGFLYYFYLKNSLESSYFYTIASLVDGSLEGAKIMAAIMKGKGGEREKSTLMFLNLAQASPEQNLACQTVAYELEALSFGVFQQGKEITSQMIENIQNVRNEFFVFDEQAEQDIIKGNNCNNYINKAIREINLAYLDQTNEIFLRENGEYARTPQQLQQAGYIDFVPTDYQQYDTYGIVYRFNPEIGRFDYQMDNY